jgi:hypothetical protein
MWEDVAETYVISGQYKIIYYTIYAYFFPNLIKKIRTLKILYFIIVYPVYPVFHILILIIVFNKKILIILSFINIHIFNVTILFVNVRT